MVRKASNNMMETIREINTYLSQQFKSGGLNQVFTMTTFEQVITTLRTSTLLFVITLSLLGGGLIKGVYEAGYSLGKALYYFMN